VAGRGSTVIGSAFFFFFFFPSLSSLPPHRRRGTPKWDWQGWRGRVPGSQALLFFFPPLPPYFGCCPGVVVRELLTGQRNADALPATPADPLFLPPFSFSLRTSNAKTRTPRPLGRTYTTAMCTAVTGLFFFFSSFSFLSPPSFLGSLLRTSEREDTRNGRVGSPFFLPLPR